MATISEALRLPFAHFERLFNWYWWLIPIWGWFVYCGYFVKFLQGIIKGETKELPPIRPFKGLFSQGFWFFLFTLVLLIITIVLLFIPVLGILAYLYLALVTPILVLQYV